MLVIRMQMSENIKFHIFICLFKLKYIGLLNFLAIIVKYTLKNEGSIKNVLKKNLYKV